MNAFDIVLLVFACGLVVLGMLKGLVRILIGLAALFAAFALAATYHQPLAARIAGESPGEFLRLLAYAMIFVGTMLAGGLVAFLLRRLMRAALLGWADRLGGAALGLTAATLTAALLVLPVVAYSPYSRQVLAGSVLAPYVAAVADVANRMAPEELSQSYRSGIGELRRFWNERFARPEV